MSFFKLGFFIKKSLLVLLEVPESSLFLAIFQGVIKTGLKQFPGIQKTGELPIPSVRDMGES